MTWEQWTPDQWIILLTGPTAIYCSQSKLNLAKWACILGLVGQIGWFWSTYQAGQWGAFISSFFYTYAWGIGLWNHWIKKNG